MHLHTKFQQLLQNIGSGRAVSRSAYDTAWVARLMEVVPELGGPALDWLCAHQLPDGSWGAAQPFYYHDRVISTLSAVVALVRHGRKAADKRRAELGRVALERILRGATQGLQADRNGATIAFELLAPALLAEAQQLHLVPSQDGHILGRMAQLREKKLALLRGKTVDRSLTLAFSLEMLQGDAQPVFACDWGNLQAPNGAISFSPAATAYFATRIKPGDALAARYLRTYSVEGAVPCVSPIDVFEAAWVLWNLELATGLQGDLLSFAQPHLDFLQRVWRKTWGVASVSGFGFSDGDATALTFEVLTRAGRRPDIEALLSHEQENHFRCYALEADPSVSTNVHMLGALKAHGYTAQDPRVQKILLFLQRQSFQPGVWIDKWHLSPYYVSAHLYITCQGYVECQGAQTLAWLCATQRADGGWGAFMSTAEETAYCLQALIVARRAGRRVPREGLRRGVAWLVRHADPPYPPLWIGKSLYSPIGVVHATILSALALAEQEGLIVGEFVAPSRAKSRVCS